MRTGQRYGVAAFLLGALSLIIATVIFQQERFATRDPHAPAVVLGFLDRLGLVKVPDMQREVSLRAAHITSINDANAFEFLRLHGWWLGGWAIAMAMWSEFRRENTLYMSVGFVLAAFAMLFLGALRSDLRLLHWAQLQSPYFVAESRLTLPSRGLAPAGFARLRKPLMSNVSRHESAGSYRYGL